MQQQTTAPDYAWPTVEDYEKEIGHKVNEAFKIGWAMARTTNNMFQQLADNAKATGESQ